MNDPVDVFLEPDAQRINRARLDHLASLGLDLDRKRVLEVGAGIGLLTEFFEERGCDVLSTDGNPANVAEMLRRYPNRKLGLLDLDAPGELSGLGMFDVVFCYGTLYHLRDPDGALARLAGICSGVILLETIVSRGAYSELHMVGEPPVAKQAVGGVGCRPTRPWTMAVLARHFGHAYTTRDQPEHPDFVSDWSVVGHTGNLRAVFVGSRQKLAVASLTSSLPVRHRSAPPRTAAPPPARVRIDVGANRGDYSRHAAMEDPELTVHAFEPLPALYEELRRGPPNHVVHTAAISEVEGVAPFRVDRFAAASSLLPIDEGARSRWIGGELLHEEAIIYVPTTRLDRFMERSRIGRVEFLHVDAQGADLMVLRSAGERITDIDRIQCEVAVTAEPLYVDAPSKAAVVNFLAAWGFRLVGAERQSHDQEENLTFIRESANSGARPTFPTADGEEPLAGIYDLDRALASHGEVRNEGNCLALVTAPEQWFYTATVPLGPAAGERSEQRVRIALEVEVEEGAVQVGIIAGEGPDIPVATTLAAGPGWQAISLVSPDMRYAGPLVIRNAFSAGRSRARCRNLVVTAIRAPAPGVDENALGPEEAAVLATQLGAAGSALAAATFAHAEIATGVATAVCAAVEQMRGLLAAQERALVDTESPELAAALARLDAERLRRLVDDFAFLQALSPVPGWRFGSFRESSDPGTFLRVALWRSLQLIPDEPPVVVPWHGGSRLSLALTSEVSQEIFVCGRYEPNELAFLERVLRPGMVALDGGANEGAYTVFLAARVGPDGRVIAVEPSPRELTRLRANISLNRADHVTIVAAALTEKEGGAALTLADPLHAGQNTLGGFIYPGVSAAGRVSVPTTTIDMLVEVHRLDHLDVVKLDVEGAELAAVAGAGSTMDRFRPLLLLEASDAALRRQGGSLHSLLRCLEDAGYVVFRFDLATGNPALLISEHEASENLVAVHRERRFGL